MQVDGDLGIVVSEQADQGAGLGRLELHVVAVQVQVLGVGALAHSPNRAVLQRSIRELDALVAVGVVDRRDEQHQRVEPGGVLPARQPAQQHLHRFLPLHFAGVNVRLDVDADLAAGADGGWTRVPHATDHDQRQRPSFHRVAEGGRMEQPRRHGARAPHEVQDVGVRAGLAVVGAFGAGAERGGGRLRTDTSRPQDHQEQCCGADREHGCFSGRMGQSNLAGPGEVGGPGVR